MMYGASIAEISLQALILHQNHRNNSTNPIPALSTRISFHASLIRLNWVVTNIEKTINTTVVIRDTFTYDFSLDPGFKNGR